MSKYDSTFGITGATNTQKTVMLSLAEGWMLRYVDLHGWCLFQPGRSRPFARVKKRTVDEMTAKGWLTPGIATKGLGYRPAKELTRLGLKYADRLLGKNWGEDEDWDPLDGRVVKKGPKRNTGAPSHHGAPANAIIEPSPATQTSSDAGASQDAAAGSDAMSASPLPIGGDVHEERQDAQRDDDQPRFRLVA